MAGCRSAATRAQLCKAGTCLLHSKRLAAQICSIQLGFHRVFAYHAWFDGSEPSLGGSERVVAAKCVAAVGADEHAESVIAIRSAGIVVLN